MKWGTLKERGIFHGNYICIVHLNSNENSRKNGLLFRFYEQRHPRKNKYMILLAVLAHKWISAKNSFPFSVSASSKSWITFLLYPFNKMMCLFFFRKTESTNSYLTRGLRVSHIQLVAKRFHIIRNTLKNFLHFPERVWFKQKEHISGVQEFLRVTDELLTRGTVIKIRQSGVHLLHWSGSNATFALVNDSENCNDKPGWIYSFVSDLRTARNNSPWLYGFVEVRSTHFKQQRTPRERYYPWKDEQKHLTRFCPISSLTAVKFAVPKGL